MHKFYPLEPVLLIEGMVVPMIRGQTTFTINAPAVGIFDVVPLKELNDIRPRTLVQVAVNDFESSSGYKMLYEGEVYAYNFGKSASGSRSLKLMTMDFSNYWDNAKVNFLNLNQTGGTLADVLSNFANADALESNKQTTKGVVTGTKSEIARIVEDELKKNGGDLALAVMALSKELININEFYSANANRLKLDSRIAATSAGNLKSIFDYERAKGLWDYMASQLSGSMPFRSILTTFLDMIFHKIVTVPFPYKNGSKVNQFVIHPDAYMLAPPACNVIFPNQYGYFEVQRNFFQEVTRLSVSASVPIFNPQTASVLAKKFYAPGFYEEFMGQDPTYQKTYFGAAADAYLNTGVTGKKYGERDEKHSYSKEVRDFQEFSQEELTKGIFAAPAVDIPGVVQLLSTMSANQSGGNANLLLQNVAYYLYNSQRYAARSTSVSGRLNFAPVPGFPVIFIDPSEAGQTIVAMLDSITHVLDGEAGASTIYNISYARNVEEKEDFNSNALATPPIPPWFDSSMFGTTKGVADVLRNSPYKDLRTLQGIVNVFGGNLDSYYNNLFGCGAITTTKHSTILEAARKLSYGFTNAEDYEAYSRSVRKRPYITLDESMSFMGARGNVTNGNGIYTGGNLISYPADSFYSSIKSKLDGVLKDRRGVIEKYRARILTNRTFGSG